MKPVCWYGSDMEEFYTPEQYEEFVADGVADGLVPLYAEPPKREWVGLTDEEVNEIYEQTEQKVGEHWDSGGTDMLFPATLYRAIEAKLKEKNSV